jgi:putative spermidine/putrescine transport system substrate-binding protein
MYGMSVTMRRAVFVAAACLFALAAESSAQTSTGKGEVVITTLGGSIEAAQKKYYFEPFERETGIKVVLVPRDAGKLLTSVERGKPEADLTNISGGEMTRWLNHKALEKIDYKYFDADTLAGIPDQLKHEYGVGALIYSIVMAYNLRDFPDSKPRPQTWADFWDVAKFPGPRGMAGCGDRLISGGVLEFASLAAGVRSDKLYPIDIGKAFAKLEELRPNVGKWWQEGAEAPQALIDGELSISTAFNGRIYVANKQGAPVDLNWNGSLLQYDYWVVPKGSPNAQNAMSFLAFISKAAPQAAFAREMTFGPINKKAYAEIPAELAKWLPGSPENAPKQIFQNFDWWNETGADGKTNWEHALETCVATLGR